MKYFICMYQANNRKPFIVINSQVYDDSEMEINEPEDAVALFNTYEVADKKASDSWLVNPNGYEILEWDI